MQLDILYYTKINGKQPVRQWLEGIQDSLAQAILYKRIRQAGLGQFGVTRFVGDGVSELKINFGPGYRIYYGLHHHKLIVLLIGGTKRTQQADIEKAKKYWKQWQKERNR